MELVSAVAATGVPFSGLVSRIGPGIVSTTCAQSCWLNAKAAPMAHKILMAHLSRPGFLAIIAHNDRSSRRYLLSLGGHSRVKQAFSTAVNHVLSRTDRKGVPYIDRPRFR